MRFRATVAHEADIEIVILNMEGCGAKIDDWTPHGTVEFSSREDISGSVSNLKHVLSVIQLLDTRPRAADDDVFTPRRHRDESLYHALFRD